METIQFTEGLATNSGIPVVGVKKVGHGCFAVLFAHSFDTHTGEVTDADTKDVWYYPASGRVWGIASGHPADLNGPITPPEEGKTLGDLATELDDEIMSYTPGSAQWRKQRPVYTGVLKYFPDAILEVAHCSFVGNEQHHPGTEVHWDKSKSADEHDAMIRHSLEAGTIDTDGVRHSAKVAWRALAALQRELDAEKETALESAA